MHFGIAATLALLLAATSVLADPFSDLDKDGIGVCFRRAYEPAHLQKNPRQQVTSMTVWITGKDQMGQGNMGLALTRRSDAEPVFLSGGCDWQEMSNVEHWMPSYKKKAGAGCVTMAVPDVFPEASSAKEGGAVILDPAADGKTMIVHIDDTPSMVKRARRWDVVPMKLGRDDRVFLLRRTALKDCDFVRDAVTTREPPIGERKR